MLHLLDAPLHEVYLCTPHSWCSRMGSGAQCGSRLQSPGGDTLLPPSWSHSVSAWLTRWVERGPWSSSCHLGWGEEVDRIRVVMSSGCDVHHICVYYLCLGTTIQQLAESRFERASACKSGMQKHSSIIMSDMWEVVWISTGPGKQRLCPELAEIQRQQTCWCLFGPKYVCFCKFAWNCLSKFDNQALSSTQTLLNKCFCFT